eukprot:SAG11_NODE_25676_length_355_cov_1.390625_1_plen_38_part_01
MPCEVFSCTVQVIISTAIRSLRDGQRPRAVDGGGGGGS